MATVLFSVRFVCLPAFILISAWTRAGAQDTTTQDDSSSSASAPVDVVPRVPGLERVLRGFNAGLTSSVVHDSSIGWYNIVTPAVSYTVSPHYSLDASLSIYPYRLAPNENPAATASQRLLRTYADLGDTLIGLHGYFNPHAFQHTVTASLTAPTGNREDGLGTGRVTFDVRDHIERYIHQTGFILDLGAGDSSGLFNRLVMDESSSLGPIAHFQTGVILWLPKGNYLQSVAYEQLPIGDQKIYGVVSAPGKPSQTVVTGRSVTEDNGFTTSLGIPLTSRVTLASYYNRSLRLHLDTVSVGLTYVLKGTPRRKSLSLIDRAIREAEGATPYTPAH